MLDANRQDQCLNTDMPEQEHEPENPRRALPGNRTQRIGPRRSLCSLTTRHDLLGDCLENELLGHGKLRIIVRGGSQFLVGVADR